MKKSEFIELARKNGVTVINYYGKSWFCFITINKTQIEGIKETKHLKTLIKFLTDNKIKINNVDWD
jgi:hypothetical protein